MDAGKYPEEALMNKIDACDYFVLLLSECVQFVEDVFMKFLLNADNSLHMNPFHAPCNQTCAASSYSKCEIIMTIFFNDFRK